MALSQEQERIYSIDDIYNLPEGVRAELIDGQIYYMAPPNSKHQLISSELFLLIGNFIKSQKGKCKVIAAPYGVFLDEDDKTSHVEPDISVICDPNKIKDEGCYGAPDWIIEITSPSTARYDYIEKLTKYCKSGVQEYWIVNPSKQSVTVYDFREDEFSPVTYTFKDKIKVNIYEDLVIDFNEITI